MNGNLRAFAGIMLAASIVLLLGSCASKPDIVGKWREVGKPATIEFSPNGAFKAVDNQGMAVTGKYTLKDGTLWCEIQHEGASKEVVNLKISIAGDELLLAAPKGGGVERYRRDK